MTELISMQSMIWEVKKEFFINKKKGYCITEVIVPVGPRRREVGMMALQSTQDPSRGRGRVQLAAFVNSAPVLWLLVPHPPQAEYTWPALLLTFASPFLWYVLICVCLEWVSKEMLWRWRGWETTGSGWPSSRSVQRTGTPLPFEVLLV